VIDCGQSVDRHRSLHTNTAGQHQLDPEGDVFTSRKGDHRTSTTVAANRGAEDGAVRSALPAGASARSDALKAPTDSPDIHCPGPAVLGPDECLSPGASPFREIKTSPSRADHARRTFGCIYRGRGTAQASERITSMAETSKSSLEALPRIAPQLSDDILLPDETVKIRIEARAFAERVLAPVAADLNSAEESSAAFPRKVLRAMADAGLYEIPFTADVGGRGLQYPMLAAATVLEELAYYTPGVASALYDGQALLVGRTLDAAPLHIRDEFLPRLIRGEIVGSFATSEPDASTDLSAKAMRTTAVEVSGGYRLSGRKRWITNSCAADIMTVLCVLDGAQIMLLVDVHAEGVTVSEPDRKMGNRLQLTSDVEFNDVFVPAEHLIAEPGRGLVSALKSLSLGRIGVGAMGVGMAQSAFDHAVRHMRERSAFGSKLGGFQHWQFRFAEHAIAIECARSLYQKAARKSDDHDAPEPEAAMAKVTGSRAAVDVTRDAIQVHGGYGYVRSLTADGRVNHLESIWRDSKVGEIYEGANEVQLWSIARVALGRDVTG
jgi:alkylation response protein AidB-like acyl-CoA dehydrogenase